ncbi:MAG: four helix bundle protein [Candidatus Nomurabacteria bacterium]|nr:four helix bundle protein [Candidatus Nomurabacteria bacterium]
MPRIGRYTTGARIENHFLDLLELIYKAYYAPIENKSNIIVEAISKNDIIKYLLQIAFENKLIKEKQYLELSSKLHEVGKILGGWKNSIEQKISKQKPPDLFRR